MSGAFDCMGRAARETAAGFVRSLGLCAVVSILGISAFGQKPGPPKLPPISVNGTVVQVVPGGISVNSPTNETWILHIPPAAKIEVTGTADPDLLRPDAFVRLTALVDTRRTSVSEPVHQLTLIDVADRPGRRLGAFRPGQDEPPVPGTPAAVAGAHPPLPDLGGPPPGSGDQALLDIRGQIKSYRPGQMILEVPGLKSTLRLELADSLTVALDVSNYGLAQPGDTISSKGVQIDQRAAQASEVSIVLNAPVSDPKKRPEPVRPTRPVRRPPEAKEQGANGQNAFDVAGQMGQGGAEPMTQPTPPTTQPAAAATAPAATSPDGGMDLVAMLTAEPGSTTLPNIRVQLGDAPPVVFIPCKRLTGADLRRQFGQPDKVFDLRGELPVGRDRNRQQVRWEMWLYGDVKVFIDETGSARYRQAR